MYLCRLHSWSHLRLWLWLTAAPFAFPPSPAAANILAGCGESVTATVPTVCRQRRRHVWKYASLVSPLRCLTFFRSSWLYLNHRLTPLVTAFFFFFHLTTHVNFRFTDARVDRLDLNTVESAHMQSTHC